MRVNKQYVLFTAIVFLNALLIAPALGRSSRAQSKSKDAGQPQAKSAPRATQPSGQSRAPKAAPAPKPTARQAPSRSTTSRRSTPAPAPSRSTRSTRSSQSRRSAPATPPKPAARQTPSRSTPAPAPSRPTTSTRSSQSRSSTPAPASPKSTAPRASSRPSSSRSGRNTQSTPASPAPSRSTSSRSSRKTVSRPVNRTVEVVSRSSTPRSSSAQTSSTAAKSTSNRATRTIIPGRVASASSTRSARTTSSAAEGRKVSSSSVARKITPPAKKQERTTAPARSTATRTSEATFDVHGRASSRNISKSDRQTAKRSEPRTSRMKVIGAGKQTERDRTSRIETGDLSSSTRLARTDPLDSKTSRVVQRKTARRPRSNRLDSTEGSRTETLTQSVQRSTDMSPRRTRTTSVRSTETTMVTATDLGERRTSFRQRRSDESRIVINGDNNVIVQGDVTVSNPRPYIQTRHLRHDVHHYHDKPRWKSHSGFYFSFHWSNSSCGRVAYLPYRYYHSWCHYPYSHNYYYGLSYYYPRYHRKYIYVSIGGYWPSWYRYRRYYWYGCHPYYWYGTHVITEPYQNVTYNTYNYYSDSVQSSDYSLTSVSRSGNSAEQLLDEPEYESVADLCFTHAVELFETENYEDAALQFREAVVLSPDDIVLPFTYSQALFANGDYAHAASVLREAIAQIPEDELTVYYPRGLYKDEAILTKQIEQLESAAAKEPFNSDYQLLLGYQYLGYGKLDKAHQPLTEAAQGIANTITASKLLELAAKLEEEATEVE